MEPKILIVDDSPSITKLLEFNLNYAGFQVLSVNDGTAVFPAMKDFKPSLIVLDVMLPRMDGMEVIRQLRSQNNVTPIILLTALHDLSDRITGFELGADDYMTKPFSVQELICRIKSVLRRINLQIESNLCHDIEIAGLKIYPDRHEVYFEGNLVDLTPKEYELLLYLSMHHDKALTREQLLQGVWKYEFWEDTRIVDVHISNLREKIEENSRKPQYIITIRNVGYKIRTPHKEMRKQI